MSHKQLYALTVAHTYHAKSNLGLILESNPSDYFVHNSVQTIHRKYNKLILQVRILEYVVALSI